ncbi:Glucosaminyl phosphatidylinositol (GlcN-PI) nositol acylation protein [Malassezia sp. CBS 17886]|nr:Glucosaminyl phosphatidylinositol (GlcN-PI) nositol acylation protein [Malassezia sp. CBS 17886]
MASRGAWLAYKERKEAWVSGQEGGSVTQILLISMTTVASYSMWLAVRQHDRVRRYPLAADFVVLVVPIFLACTLLSSHAHILLVCVAPPALLAYTTGAQLGRRASVPAKLGERGANECTRTAASLPPLVSRENGHDQGSPGRSPTLALAPSEVYESNAFTESGGNSGVATPTYPGDVEADATAHLGAALLNLDEPLASWESAESLANIPAVAAPPAQRSAPVDMESGPGDEERAPESAPGAVAPGERQDQLAFITVYRTYLMVLTVICILAVDFPVFDRALAKCESWGTSLMDIGVGAFVFSHGVVSARASRNSVLSTVRRTLPLLALGIARVALVKRTDYPEHASEYGVHWNFFITLALLVPALDAARLLPAARRRWLVPAALGLASVHQLLLSATRLGPWAIAPQRSVHSILSLNKEGVTSLPGYIVIGFLGFDTGALVFARDAPRKLCAALLWRALASWAAFAVLRSGIGLQPSRRLEANVAYVAFVAAYNVTFLLLYACMDLSASSDPRGARTPPLFAALNRHALAIFLLANAVTGGVNLLMYTMHAPTWVSMPLLSAYLVTTCFLAPTALEHLRRTVDEQRRQKLAQYSAKLQRKADERGLGSVEELTAELHEKQTKAQAEETQRRNERTEKAAGNATVEDRDSSLRERLRTQRREREAQRQQEDPAAQGPIKPLSAFMDMDKMAHEAPEDVSKLWTAYHMMQDKLSAAVPQATYTQMLANAERFPQFVLPLPREGSAATPDVAYEIFYMQWMMLPPSPTARGAPPPSAVLFTSLAQFKLRNEYAQPALVLTNYTDFYESKNIVLMRGDVTDRPGADGESGAPMLSQADAQLLTVCMQRFYNLDFAHESAGTDMEADERRSLLKSFNEDPAAFDVEKLVAVAYKM